MTKEVYWLVFNKEQLSGEQWQSISKMLKVPDIKKMKSGYRDL